MARRLRYAAIRLELSCFILYSELPSDGPSISALCSRVHVLCRWLPRRSSPCGLLLPPTLYASGSSCSPFEARARLGTKGRPLHCRQVQPSSLRFRVFCACISSTINRVIQVRLESPNEQLLIYGAVRSFTVVTVYTWACMA